MQIIWQMPIKNSNEAPTNPHSTHCVKLATYATSFHYLQFFSLLNLSCLPAGWRFSTFFAVCCVYTFIQILLFELFTFLTHQITTAFRIFKR